MMAAHPSVRPNGRADLLDSLKALIQERCTRSRPLLVGIDGVNAAGKTTFAQHLSNRLERSGHRTQLVHVDDFHNPKSYRYSGGREDLDFLYRYVDSRKLSQAILRPIRDDAQLRVTLTLLDLATDEFTLVRSFDVDPRTIVIVEGIFLFKADLLSFFDLTLYLDISFETSVARGKARWNHMPADEVEERFRRRYLPGQQLYFDLHDPKGVANIVVDNEDPESPVVLRSCSSIER